MSTYDVVYIEDNVQKQISVLVVDFEQAYDYIKMLSPGCKIISIVGV